MIIGLMMQFYHEIRRKNFNWIAQNCGPC